ncbi:MAG: hypothetical protein IKA90_02215, partial [Clostridia bacterium]|nr:hypothetical protein [Clostridia bacterium]
MKSFVKCAKIILMAILCLSLSLLYVACSNEDFKLSYTAGTGGIISGQTTQTVAKGKNGSEVVAIANTGYVFVKWSDGVTASSRTDKNVQNDVSVSAEFEAKNSNVELDLATAQTLYQFSIFDNQVTITKYIGSAAEVEIPSKIGGKPVVAIGSAAFEYCDSLTSITI